MAFLSPLWLLAALAAAVPLAIHLLRRRTGVPVDFPAVRWLQRAEREHSRSLRLRNLLLMLLRVGAVLLFALAAAQPMAPLPGAGHAPTALAIVLDNSLSTSAIANGHPVLDDLKARAAAIAARAAAGDQLRLVTADGAVTGGDAAAVRRAIDAAVPLGGAGNVEGAARTAAALAAAAPLAAHEVAIVTDGQATAWRDPLALGAVRVAIYRPAGDPPANRAVTAAAAEPARWTPRGAVHATVRAGDSAAYRITLGGRTLARGTAAKGGDVYLLAAPPERGWQAGTVELEPDELRGDDVRWFAVWIGPPPAVRAAPSAGEFVRAAVASLAQASRVAEGDGIAITGADDATRLPALLIAPADPVRAGAADRALERLGVPWRFGALARGRAPVPAMNGVTVSERYALRRAGIAPAETLATVNGEPWIVAGPGYVLVASPLDPRATDLPLRAAFIPWLADVLTQRLGAGGRVTEAAPLAPVMRDGERTTAPGAPGVYWTMKGNARDGALVVNPEPGESDLARLDSGALASRVRAAHVDVFTDAPAFAAAPFRGAARRPVGLWLAALAAAMLVAESLALAAPARRAEG